METIKFLYNRPNKLTLSIERGRHVSFIPGTNEIPKEDWEKLIASTSPGGLQHFLDNRGITVVGQEAENPDDPPPESIADVGVMSGPDAIDVVKNTFDSEQLEKVRASEDGRKGGPRQGVKKAISEMQDNFDAFDKAKAEGNKLEPMG